MHKKFYWLKMLEMMPLIHVKYMGMEASPTVNSLKEDTTSIFILRCP